jgi:hypothetical protein
MRDAIDDTFYSNNNSLVTQITEIQEAAHIPWGTVLTNRSNYLALLERERAYLWTSVGRREAGRQ